MAFEEMNIISCGRLFIFSRCLHASNIFILFEPGMRWGRKSPPSPPITFSLTLIFLSDVCWNLQNRLPNQVLLLACCTPWQPWASRRGRMFIKNFERILAKVVVNWVWVWCCKETRDNFIECWTLGDLYHYQSSDKLHKHKCDFGFQFKDITCLCSCFLLLLHAMHCNALGYEWFLELEKQDMSCHLQNCSINHSVGRRQLKTIIQRLLKFTSVL